MSEKYFSHDEDETFENALEFLLADEEGGNRPGPSSEETDSSAGGCLAFLR